MPRNVWSRRGEAHWAAKLTEAEVREIRRRAAAGERTGTLAEVFGVDPSHVRRILRRAIWRHLVASPCDEGL